MKRNIYALGASVLTLALTSGSAWAAPVATQTVDHSVLAAQAGSVAVNAPVRVLSDGQNGAPAAASSAGGSQTAGHSVGVVQTGPVNVNAPVRVLSDGDNASAPAGGSGPAAGPQAVDHSVGAVQAGPIGANAPVRVASDGHNGSSPGGAGAGGASQSSDHSVGSVQVASIDADVPVRVLSKGDNEGSGTGGTPSGPQSVTDSVGVVQIGPFGADLPIRVLSDGDESPPPASGAQSITGRQGSGSNAGGRSLASGDDEVAADAPGQGGRSPGEIRSLSGSPAPGGARLAAAAVRDLGVLAAGGLPLTGLGLACLMVLGLLSLAGGSGLRLAQR
jgi:hypothetical protein